ncbi:response regulator, partial [Deltaproteobacteria bacterium OttesenSCG-928-K17]|nr:response regulator [Deltaproteobacteria bacterium OttesenSCG-928-K17]
QVTDQVTTKASEKGVEFLVKVPGDTPAGLVGDQIRLAQILSNLSSNAMKFTEKGQVTLKVETVSESPSEVTLKFLMEDSGIGMTEDQCANLFTAFSQAERSTTRRYGGTGLGLTISKSLVEMMGGQIWCESRPGVGSTFGFTATFGRHDSENRYLATNRDFSGLAALAVDDNVVALDIVSDFLRVLGFSVATASSGAKALEIIEEKHRLGLCFDLILLDWKMPGLDGVEVAKAIKEGHTEGPPPVIIMTTAYNRDNVLKEAQANGVTNVMTKPLSPTTMLNMLVDIFGRGKAQTNPRLKKARDLAQAVDFAGGRILLAEDNEVNQLVASRILKNAGLMVDIAENGLKAVQMVRENTYDLVLMDIQMPEMDGITATKEIRAMPGFENLPIVAMTANAMSGDKELSLSAGMNDHINKPINLQELFSSLARWLKKNEV